jgi:hypothetical protein
MISAWRGDISYKKAIAENRLKLVGPAALTKSIGSWIRGVMFEGIAPADEIRSGHVMGSGI